MLVDAVSRVVGSGAMQPGVDNCCCRCDSDSVWLRLLMGLLGDFVHQQEAAVCKARHPTGSCSMFSMSSEVSVQLELSGGLLMREVH